MKNSLILFAALILAGFISCSRNQTLNSSFAITKVFETDILPSFTYELEADKGGEFKTSTGTRIIIPADAFTDEQGNTVTGKVKIEFEEYHTAAEIMASGIPMMCKDASGEMQNFESAGMFNINGKAGEKPLKIKDGKAIDIQVASNKSGTYDFFMFDVAAGSWQKMGSTPEQQNMDKMQQLEEIEKEMPQQPLEPKKLTANLPLVELKVDYRKQPEFKAFKNVFWELRGTPQEIAKNKELVASAKWEITLQPDPAAEGAYILNLKDKAARHTVKVLPVLLGQDLEIAKKSFAAKFASYNQKLELKKDEQKRVQAEGNLLRGFQINAFGSYNWDRFYNAPSAMRITPTFEFDKEVYNEQSVSVFLITDDVVMKYVPNYTFIIVPGRNNRLVAVLPGNEIAVFTNGEFSALNTQAIKKTGKATFKLKSTGRKITKIDELNDLIASL